MPTVRTRRPSAPTAIGVGGALRRVSPSARRSSNDASTRGAAPPGWAAPKTSYWQYSPPRAGNARCAASAGRGGCSGVRGGLDPVGEDRGRDPQLAGEGYLEALQYRAGRAARRVAHHEADLGHAGRQLELAGERAPGGALAGRRGDRDRGVPAEEAAAVAHPDLCTGLEARRAVRAGCDRSDVELGGQENVDDVARPRLLHVRDRAQGDAGLLVRGVEGPGDRGVAGRPGIRLARLPQPGPGHLRAERVALPRSHRQAGPLHLDAQLPPFAVRPALGRVEAEEVVGLRLGGHAPGARREVVRIADGEATGVVG